MGILINVNPEKRGLTVTLLQPWDRFLRLVGIFFLSIGGISANLFVVLLECRKILTGF